MDKYKLNTVLALMEYSPMYGNYYSCAEVDTKIKDLECQLAEAKEAHRTMCLRARVDTVKDLEQQLGEERAVSEKLAARLANKGCYKCGAETWFTSEYHLNWARDQVREDSNDTTACHCGGGTGGCHGCCEQIEPTK